MSSAVLRYYYNRKTAPRPRQPQVISDFCSKLDHSDAPFVINDVPLSPFALDLKYAASSNEDNVYDCNAQTSKYSTFGYGNLQPSMPSLHRNFSTRVMEQDYNWKQQIASFKYDPIYQQLHNNQQSIESKNNTSCGGNISSFEEAKTGSQERDTVRSVPHMQSSATSNSPQNSRPLQTVPSDDSEDIPHMDHGGLSTDHLIATLEALSRRGDWRGCMNIIRSSACDMKCYEIAMRCCSDSSGMEPMSVKSKMTQLFSATPADEAMWLLQEMQSKYFSVPGTTQPPFSKNDMMLYVLRSLSRSGRPVEALQLFQEHGESNGRALTHALHACAVAAKVDAANGAAETGQRQGDGNWADTAMHILRANQKRAKLNHYNIVLSAIASGGNLKQAVQFVDDMRTNTRFKADSYTWSTLFWACSTAQCLGKEDEPNGALVALEIFATLRKNEAHNVNAHVFAAALRAVTGGVAGPSYPTSSAVPEEFRVDPITGQGSNLNGFKIKHGPKVGTDLWHSCESSNVVGMWRAMISAGYAPPADVTAEVMYHARYTATAAGETPKAAQKVAVELARQNGKGWRAANIMDYACFAEAYAILTEMNDKAQLKKLVALRMQLLKDHAASEQEL